jgi:hypothetical protein
MASRVSLLRRVGVLIDLTFDELFHSVNTITHDAGHFAFVGGDHFAAHDQKSVFVAKICRSTKTSLPSALAEMVGCFNFGLC